uniref:Polycystic kidney disease protein 1-like 2 n=1 Tax=Scophthalmus maximus TaxID=52904 RepID=A0A8D3E2G5_SCOMX
MCWSVQQLLILVTLGRLSCGGDEAELSVSCPGHQRASEGSCYEFVAQERSFSGAQACCEERGGHLAFVPNKDTQHFLQRHLDPEKDVWLGVALSASPNLQYSATVGGALFWLDGSNVTYSNWASSPEPGAACGHILKDSGFQWEATRDCNKKLCFICQFESRRKVVCAGRDNTLRCGSGQVLMIDGGFYGRKNAHYCRPTTSSPTTSAQRHCGWVDVEESLRALCHGRQFCQIAELVTSAGEPCPQLGSYLSVDYQCKDGLTLSASTVAAVLTDITIDIKWLLHLTSGKPVCRLSTGDGHVIYLDSPEGLESSVVHKYKSPSTFVMAVECTSGDVHVTVQKIITISEPVTDISVTGCYAAAQSFHATNCKALHGGAFHIEMELKAGSNVTYRAQRDEMVLSGSSAERGNIPRNITVTAEMVKQLGPGCHQLTIFASNPVTIPEVSTDLQVCVLENVVGLWASVLMERDECGRSPHITVDVSLEKGAPVLLLFSLTGGDNDSFYESREMNARKGIFHIGHPIHGTENTENCQGKRRGGNYNTRQHSYNTRHGNYNTRQYSYNTRQYNYNTRHYSYNTHGSTATISGSTTTIPGTATTFPSSTATTPGLTTTIPGTATTIPSSTATTPGFTTTIPGSATTIPGTAATIPGSSTTIPGTTATIPGSTTTIPGTATTIPGSTATIPGTITTTTATTRATTSPANTTNVESLLCSISPLDGTVLDAFNITCEIKIPCCTCLYCFNMPSYCRHLLCSKNNKVTSVFLPLGDNQSNYNLIITATAKNDSFVVGTNITTQVCQKYDGINHTFFCECFFFLLKLRERMLDILTRAVDVVPANTPEEVQVIARSLTAVSVKVGFQCNYALSTNSQMLCVDKNPFSWNEKGNISGKIVALSLTTKDGATIRLENLTVFCGILPDRFCFQGLLESGGNASVLDLGNYSTMVIDVPSTDTTLVLKDPLPFKVFLGYMSYPTEANHVAMTEMPQQGTTQEQRYTWLVDPKNFRGKTGVHYLVVRPIVGPGIKSINASLLVTSISAACKFWNESLLEWSNRGCRVGVQTTHSVTQCLCNHLTFFGSSFFVTPNLVDPSRSAELFATFAENPVVVCFVGALFVAYLLVVVWARRKDIKDTAKVRVTVLEDNDPIDEYRYLLSVSTGHRRGASTSSQVTLTLLGADGNSEPHHLADPKKRLFESGAVDMFLLTTPFSLGDLQSLRLWHNNTGSHPAWYVGHVTVQDVQTNQKWHFLCNSWLAIDVGNCCLDQVFPVSSEMDLKSFSNLFFMKTTKDLRDGHLWYSVISRPPSSTFTCVQRVSCCFSLLLCTMLTSIMFYGIPTDPSEQTMDLGHFEFTWQQFMVGVQSSLVMFPVNILIVSIFRHTRPRETSCCKRRQEKPCPQTPSSQTASNDKKVNVTLDLIIKDITRIAHSLFLSAKSNIPFTESTEFGPGQQHDINAVLSAVDDFVRRNYKTGDGADRVQSQPSGGFYHSGLSVHEATRGILEYAPFNMKRDLYLSEGFSLAPVTCRSSLAGSTGGGGDRKKSGCCRGGLPWWFIFVGWLLVIATSSVAGYFTMIYGLKFGKERSISWLVSMIVSFFQSILVIQPLKVLCLAAFFALVIKKVDEEDFQNVTFDSNDQQTVREDRNLYEPPPPADVDRMKRNKIMEQKAFALLREIFIYTGFMWMLLLVAHGQRDPNAFFLHQHIRKSFGGGVSRSMSLGDVFAWANTSLLSNLFGAYPGFITDGNSRLVGNARLRQLRVQRSSCQIAGSMLQLVSDCHAPYSREVEDTGSYDSGWNQSLGGNATMSTSGPWTYQAQARLRARPLWGKMVVYRGGGFVAELGPDLKNASRTIEYLFRNKWLDVYTRAFIVEFTIYNANVNLFGIVTLLLETTAVGAFQLHSELQSVRLYQSTGSLHIFVMAAEVTYVLFIIYYMFLQGKLMKQQGGAYFRSKWNLLELSIIILSWSAVAVFITRTLIGNRDMTYYQNHRDQFVSFHETAAADSVLSYLIAFVLMLATVKLWHLLRLNPKMNMLTATLQRAWGDISSFLVVIGIMLVAYSTACNVIYGWKISSYRTFADALLTIISLQIGIFNYSEVLDYTPLLGGLLIGSCIVFMTFVVLNLLISVILVAFKQEQTDHKPSEEKEIVDLMLKKIYSFFGIRYDDKKDPRGPDTTGSSGPTLNTSRNLLS